MTARDRKAFGGTSATANVAPAPTSAVPVPTNGRNGADTGVSRAFCWEEWFQSATPSQRSEMLALATRQGLLYAHQVAAAANGTKNKAAASRMHCPLLDRLLAGQLDELSPPAVPCLAFRDEDLDACQREAVARATATPDIFLLQGYPGTGRSRVLAEILHQATQRGDRVLYLSNQPASLDAVLLRLLGDPQVLAIRYLQPDEGPLPAELLPCTLSERQKLWQKQLQEKAVQARADAQNRCLRRQAEESCWAPLQDLAGRLEHLGQCLRANTEKLIRLLEDVELDASASTGPFGAFARQMEQQHRERLAVAKGALDQRQQTHAAVVEELAKLQGHILELRPLAEIKRQGRWWTLRWWRATFAWNILARFAELEKRQEVLQDNLAAGAEDIQQKEKECRQASEQFQVDRADLLKRECERRRRDYLEQEDAYLAEQERLRAIWQNQIKSFEAPDYQPVEPTVEAVSAAHNVWIGQRRLDDEACDFAARWADYQAHAGAELAGGVSAWANVVAGTMPLAKADATLSAAGPFDLLVLDNAEQFTEIDVTQAASWAPRWVLVAETHALQETPEERMAGPQARPELPRLGCFQKLWQTLHCDSRHLHYAWSCEKDRLCCTLRPVAAPDRAHLEIEHVADFPEIELRILATPKTTPLLAQVVFPSHFSILEAKTFIYRELEEVTIQCIGSGAWLSEESGRICLHLDPRPAGAPASLELEKGLHEFLSPDTANTCRLEFDQAAGWDRLKVTDWLQKHLQLRDLGRTIALQVPHRMFPGLGASVNNIVFGGACYPLQSLEQQGVFEFVAVPPLAKASKQADKGRPHGGNNGSNGLPREGAGLEQDLTIHRLADRLPSDLRSQLPRRGFANYLEAQAVIRKLEELFKQPDTGPVAVIALYEGQVELLRCLAGRSDLLRRSRDLLIGLPSVFQEREWQTVLVSLTRSHGHRPVALGERPEDLAVALTRARRLLIVFGDPGTLAKRSHWQGPLDHLDVPAANLEAKRVTALLTWVANIS